MARLLKEPVKKKTLKGLRRGMRLTYPEIHVPGKLNQKNTKSGRMISKRNNE